MSRPVAGSRPMDERIQVSHASAESRPWAFRFFAVGLVVCAMLAAKTAFADTASAGFVDYNCGVLAPHQYCLHNGAAQYTQSWVWYEGANERRMSTKLIFASDGRLWGEAWGQGNNGSGNSVKLFSWRYGNSTKPLISNNSQYYHTFKGRGVW